MHKIYSGKRCISVEKSGMSSPAPENVRPIVESFLKAGGPARLILRTDEPETLFSRLCGCFHEVTAAGGLVRNGQGEYLLIERNGLWDLPKGHLECGEQTTQTALREVREETGVAGPELGELICVTHHCYPYGEEMRLKHTWWYRMYLQDGCETVPQTEENITRAVWMKPSEVWNAIHNTYPSLIEVFTKGVDETF